MPRTPPSYHFLELYGGVVWLLALHLSKEVWAIYGLGGTICFSVQECLQGICVVEGGKDGDDHWASGFKSLIPLHKISDAFET